MPFPWAGSDFQNPRQDFNGPGAGIANDPDSGLLPTNLGPTDPTRFPIPPGAWNPGELTGANGAIGTTNPPPFGSEIRSDELVAFVYTPDGATYVLSFDYYGRPQVYYFPPGIRPPPNFRPPLSEGPPPRPPGNRPNTILDRVGNYLPPKPKGQISNPGDPFPRSPIPVGPKPPGSEEEPGFGGGSGFLGAVGPVVFGIIDRIGSCEDQMHGLLQAGVDTRNGWRAVANNLNHLRAQVTDALVGPTSLNKACLAALEAIRQQLSDLNRQLTGIYDDLDDLMMEMNNYTCVVGQATRPGQYADRLNAIRGRINDVVDQMNQLAQQLAAIAAGRCPTASRIRKVAYNLLTGQGTTSPQSGGIVYFTADG